MSRKYSVLMSVYKRENPIFFAESIESMLRQTEFPDEIVIVKDGPLTKELEKVIECYSDRYPGLFTIFPLSTNGGLGRALNYGLKIAKNELIARMDTDDISLPERCSKQLDEFEKNGRLCICGTQINEFIGEQSNVVSSRLVPCDFEGIKRFAKRRSPFNHPTVMYRKSVVLASGGYLEYGRKEDLDLFLRMVNRGCYSINLPESLLLYRTSEANLKRRKTWVNCKEYIDVIAKNYKKGYTGLSDLMYVVLGQTIMFVSPRQITTRLSNAFLRESKGRLA